MTARPSGGASSNSPPIRTTALALLIAACAVPLVWVGDAPFINDEPLLVLAAVTANAKHALAPMGLLGTYGFSYGPAPTWIYQVLLSVTHDLVIVATLHTLLFVAVTAGALWWLSRSLGLWVWFAPLPLLSPYFWFYARALWDNPFLMPLGALAIAGYAAHLQSGSPTGLRVSMSAMIGMLLVHLMSLALIVPLAAHMLVVRWRELWAHRISVIVIAVIAASAAWPYWMYLIAPHAPTPSPGILDGWLFPLAGARLLTAGQLDYFFGPGPVDGARLHVSSTVSTLAYPLVWSGIGIALWEAWRAVRTRTWKPRSHVAVILLGMLACQSVIDGVSAKFQHPQYQNATWIATVLFAWLTIDWLARLRGALRWTAPLSTTILGGALLLVVGVVAVELHRAGGTRETYGPTLANQQRVARVLARYSPQSPVTLSVVAYQLYPHTLAVLRQLNPSRASDPTANLEVRYTSFDPMSGRIGVAER